MDDWEDEGGDWDNDNGDFDAFTAPTKAEPKVITGVDDWDNDDAGDDFSAFAAPKQEFENEFDGDWESAAKWVPEGGTVPQSQPKKEVTGIQVAKPLSKAEKKKRLREALARKEAEAESRLSTAEEIRLMREKEEKQRRESDFSNALDLFGSECAVDVDEKAGDDAESDMFNVGGAEGAAAGASLASSVKSVSSKSLASLEDFSASTERDFFHVASLLGAEAKKYENHKHYLMFVTELFRVCAEVEPLNSDDIMEINKSLTTILHKKQKQEKGKKRGHRGKKGASINVRGAGSEKFEDHTGGEYDDYLDFM